METLTASKISAKIQFQHFCNSLYLGQWELAKACIKQLHTFGDQQDFTVTEVLKDLVRQPFNRCIQSLSVPSPCQLSWLALLECEKLQHHGSESQTESTLEDRELVQFHLLLVEVCPVITDTHLKELYTYYRWVHSSVSVGHTLTLSSGLLKFLQTLLSRQPSLGHALISAIYLPDILQLSKNNRAIQMVYVSSINALLDGLSQVGVDTEVKKDKSENVYKILANFDMKLSAGQLPLRQMFSKVLEYCQMEQHLISKTRIVSSMIGHKDLYLLEEFCKVDYETETNKAVSTYQACAELTEEQRWILHLSALSDIETRWKMFLMFTMNRKRHVLEVILETALALIKCSMFAELERLLEPEELLPLKPLLLLLGWQHCYSSAEARELLEKLWSNKNESYHPAITMGCNKLAYQIDLIQWCLDKAKPLLTEDSGGPQFQRASDLFKGLESHSVLYVLQNSTKLSSLDQQEVFELLQKVPLLGDQEDSSKRKTKTVRFQEISDDQSAPHTTSFDQKKDMAIFTGYCLLKNVMDVILFCGECSDKRLTHPIRSRSRHKVSNKAGSQESLTDNSSSRKSSSDTVNTLNEAENSNNNNDSEKQEETQVNVQDLYKEKVSEKLILCQKYLSTLQPLTLRVEILENIFSLLFLTHEDVQETLLLSEYGSDDGDDKSLKNMTPLLSPVKVSSGLKIPEVVVKSSSMVETSLDYDVPFEESIKAKEEITDTSLDKTISEKPLDKNKVEEALETMKASIKEKRKRLHVERHTENRFSSISENVSSYSTTSSVNLDTIGFLVNDYLVRDILAMIKDSIVDVSAVKYQIYGNKGDARERYRPSREVTSTGSSELDANTEEALCRLVKSSVTIDTLQKRITQLEKHISEAHWRFQLVSNENIPRSVGQVLQEVVMTTGDSSDEEVELRGLGQSSRKKRKSGTRSPVEQDGTTSGPLSSRETSRRSSMVTVARRPLGQMRSPKLVSLMLSSPVTLLTMSIRKGQLTQTKQIIKLFKLEEQPEAVEVYFSQAYQKACRTIQGIMGKDSSSSGNVQKKSGLKAVASVAAAGLATASVSDVADDILRFPTIPKMPKIELHDTLPQNIESIFHAENISVMILLDLTCTSAKSWDVTNHLLDTLKSLLPDKPKVDMDDKGTNVAETKSNSAQRLNKIRTFSEMFSIFQDLIHLGAGEEIPSKEQELLAKTFQKSMQYFLLNATHSLNAVKCKQLALLDQNLSKYISKTEEAFHHYCKTKVQTSPESPQRSTMMSEVRQRLGSTGSPRSRTGSEVKPVIHHSMKQLINLLGKDLPAAGVVALIARSQTKPGKPYRNYLSSLYEHCKELAYLVAESEAHHKEGMVVPNNYFEVLEEGPLRILGRMMFKKKMAPAKLEKVAGKLSLNLTHIIVYSCCVRIPSKRLPALSVTSGLEYTEKEQHSGRVIYNAAKYSEELQPGNPEEFVRSLLQKLVNLMKDVAGNCNAQGLFDMTCAQTLTKHTDFYDIITQTSVLQSADLLQMSRAEKTCFYGNLQTLMSIHCHLNYVWLMENQETNDRNSSRHKRSPLPLFGEMSTAEEILFLSTFSYRVGQLGVVSLFDLRYQILRSGLLAPSEWGRTLEHRLYPLDPCDPWYKLAPAVNPQVLFATSSCRVSSPPVQILHPDSISAQLQTSIKEYLQTSVEIDNQSNIVRLPELLLWYRRDFISGLTISDLMSENIGLLEFIAAQISGEKQQNLRAVLKAAESSPKKDSDQGKSQVDIEVIPHCKEFMCVFAFESMKTAQQTQSSIGGKSKPGDITLRLSDSETTFSLTPNTLEYIKSDCPLVATLVSLICSDDMEENLIDDAFDDSHFERSGSFGKFEMLAAHARGRTSSSMSILDLKSYRYEKLSNEYPALKRHLLNFIVPLAATEDPDILKGADPILKLLTSDVSERFKSNMLSLHESDEFRKVLAGLFDELFKLRKWKEFLEVIDCIPITVVRKETSLSQLHDFVVCCLIHKQCCAADNKVALNREKSEEMKVLLSRLLSADGQSREILSVHHKLQIDINIDLFQMCLGRNEISESMKEAVQLKYQEIKVFYRITECAKTLQVKLSLQNTEFISEEDKMAAAKRHQILDKFTNWRTVVDWTKTAPREVLALLIKAGDFHTANSWGTLENLDEDIKMEIEENHLNYLLNTQPPSTTQAFMLLEKLRGENSSACLAMCKKLLGVYNKQQDVLFIANYILEQMCDHLQRADEDSVRLTQIGAKMILCLPDMMHIEYGHLVSTPRYILEQLIMNMKPELASKAFTEVKEDLKLIKEANNKFTTEQFNTLIALYAKKALEFTVIQFLDDKERSFSVRSTSSDKMEDLARESPVLRHSPQLKHDFQHMKRKSVADIQATKYAVSAPYATGSPSSRAVTPGTKETTFVMPSEPPPRDQWVPDSSTSVCMVCKVERFSMFSRRHHCRRCGRVVCAGCSENVTPIKGVSARTCDDCYREIVKSSASLGDRRLSAAEIYQQYKMSDTSPNPSPMPTYQASTIMAIQEDPAAHSLAEVISHSHTTWKLQTDDLFNSNVREDFFFEQAPSTSLCISILNLHGSGRECGRLILKLCDDLSKFLKPIAPGVPNPEVDYNLIMSMMKYLLFHAKMKFTSCGDNAGMGQCDIYQGLVDLLGLLVVDNYKDLPSLEELMKTDSVRRLRDKLIGDERLSLAMEVSTKCGLDPTGVWVAWGMMCLQSGDFTGAREKFSKCLKPVKDKNVCGVPSKVLCDVIDCLESMPGAGSMEIQLLLASPGSVKNLVSSPSSTFFEEASMDSQQFQECLYYLRTYGSYFSLVEFHRRHGYYMKAVQYILDHKCSVEVFTEGLLKPSVETGELARLTDQMLLIDPSLEKWNSYLTASCRYFVKQRLHHVLYEFQLFMKDFLRAGMTCFTYFYQEGARSYLDLSRRINFLFTAQQHMQAYLDPAHWGNVQHPLSVPPKQGTWEESETQSEQYSVRLVKQPEDVSRYIKTIALQIEVTKFFQDCLTGAAGEAASAAIAKVASTKVPTLFGSQQVRNELAIMILMCGDNIEKSFDLSARIIKEYKLGAQGIYTHVAREMAKGHHYDNMRLLLGCVEKTDLATDDVMDEILGACLLVVADNPSEGKEAENIIKMLRNNANKINAYILCGKLKSAYLLAIEKNRVDDVKRILRAAKSMGQNTIATICTKWLETQK